MRRSQRLRRGPRLPPLLLAAAAEAPEPAVPEPAAAAPEAAAARPGGGDPEAWRDWGGLPGDVLTKVAENLGAAERSAFGACLRPLGWSEEQIRAKVASRYGAGRVHAAFPFAMVCKGWRKAARGLLRAEVPKQAPWLMTYAADLVDKGSVTLVRWALMGGCPRESGRKGAPDELWSLPEMAADAGHLELLQWLLTADGGFRGYDGAKRGARDRQQRLVWCAAFGGHLEVVRWLCEARGFAPGDEALGAAARGGRIEILEYLVHDCRLKLDWSEAGALACARAAGNDQLAALRWLRHAGAGEWGHTICVAAARGGSVRCLRYCVEEWGFRATLGDGGDNGDVWESAARAGSLEVLDYLHGLIPADLNAANLAAVATAAANLTAVATAAAEAGHSPVLRWCHARGLLLAALGPDLPAAAAQQGHVAVLQLLHEVGCPFHATAAWRAAQGGHVSVLEFIAGGAWPGGITPWDESTCSEAAGAGELECLRFAREHGCPWNSYTCGKAVEAMPYPEEEVDDGQGGGGGALACLRWVRAHGCPWTLGTLLEARDKGYVEADPRRGLSGGNSFVKLPGGG